MQWYEFVFSEKKNFKVLRHLIFWAAWWLYFLLCYYLFQLPVPGKTKPFYMPLGHHLPPKTFLLVLLYAIASYSIIYLFLPLIIKGKWFKMLPAILILFGFLFLASHFLYWNVFPLIDPQFKTMQANSFLARSWPAISLGILNFIKVAAAAIIIKYLKYWWLKQKEGERLDREKINAELQLLRAQVHPDFLFTSLNNIYVYSLAASPRTSGLLLKLSDLLSYMLYECDRPLVPLEKEITMMKDYIEMEKIRLAGSIEMELNVCGDVKNKMIAPFLLLPFIENSFKQSRSLNGNAWINMDIDIDGDLFIMKLANGIITGIGDWQETAMNGLTNVQKRLTLIYPQHELEIYKEEEMLIAHLRIHLSDTTTIAARKDEVPALEEQH